jgi:hypothetical protein
MNAFEGLDHSRSPKHALSTAAWFARRLGRSSVHFLSQNRVILVRILLLYFVLLPTILWLLLGHLAPSSEATFPSQLRNAKRAMLVVAHPDDESLFFGPTILQMTQRRPEGATAILVMSAGTCCLLSCLQPPTVPSRNR